MRKDAVDLERGIAYIEDSKTESGIRQMPLTKVALKEFAWLKASTPESPWLFPSPLKPEEHITSFKRSWKTTLRRAGISYFRAYDLRSTFATRLSAGGVPESLPSRTVWRSDLHNYQRELSTVAGDVYLTYGPVRYAIYGFRNNLNLKEIVKVRRVMGNVYPSRVTWTAEGTLKSNFQKTEAFTGQASPRYPRCCKVRILDSESMI